MKKLQNQANVQKHLKFCVSLDVINFRILSLVPSVFAHRIHPIIGVCYHIQL
jgi:hypothetical protein